MYSINVTKVNTKFWLSLHYNGTNSYFFVNGTAIHKFTTKDSEIVANNLFLGNGSKDFSASSMKKTGFNGHIYDLSVDYDAIAVDDILDIHKYLMRKNDILWNVQAHKKNVFYRTNIFIDFNICKFIKICFKEQSRMENI